MRRKFLLSVVLLSLLFMAMGGGKLYAEVNVAKVGNTEYATIDEAIAAWTNNTTLTLLSDVTLSDVVTIKSTEHHILNLGTYTMTAASGKNAFVIQACGNGSAERSTITINADANNPGGINAGSKCIIYYKYADGGISTEDRPIIKINGGVFTGSTSSSWGAGIYTIGTAARKCATLNITGGTFNCSIYGSGKSKLIVSGGVFNYSVGSQGDSTALRLISGGTFKTFGFMTADSNNTKFWFGTSMANSNVGVCVDDNGYIVVGGPVNTEAGDKFEASSENYSGADDLLQYSSAKDNGLYYTSVEEAFADNNKASGSVTVYVDELDMTGINYKGTIVVPEGEKITIVTAAGVTPTWTVSANNDDVTYTDAEGNELVKDENGSFVVPPVAKIGETSYETLQAAVDAVQNGQTITMLADAAEDVTIPAGVTFNGNGKAVGNITAAGTITFNGHTKATSFNVEYANTTINIVEEACLEITGDGRMVIGHGCTFNVTGTIENAKTANVEELTPSLIMPGASFTGAGVTFNVTNAYISAPSSYCSSSSSASGTFDFNITNSIWESAGKLAFESQSTAATVNFDLVESVLNTGSHLVFGVSRGEVVFDNSNVNVGTSRQIENQSTMTVKNGSVVKGAVATSSNAKNPGTLIVDNATYAVTGEFSGSDLGTGTIVYKKGATISAGKITKANIQIDATGMSAGDDVNITADLASLAGTIEVINNNMLDAKIVDGKIVIVERTLQGEGTADNPYLINDISDLEFFRDDVNAGNDYEGKYIKVTATEIDLNNEEWTPIGNNTNRFKGYFDGNNKTIKNLKVSGSNRYVGLFGYILGQGMSASTTPSVKDLILENVDVSGDYYVGGLSGQAYTCNITNVTVKGEVSGVRYVGGLVGHVYTYFKNCHFIGNASCSFDALGGIAGAGDCRAYDCSVIGDITGSNWVGGIVGNGQEGTSAVGCYVKGDVNTSTNWYFGVGGIAGVAGHGYSSSEFKNNYFDGNVYLEGEIVPAMIIGIVNADNNETIYATIEGNSWNTTYYDVNIPVYVTAEPPQNGTTNWIASASEELTKPRNNNLIMLESDLQYIDATSAEDVVIMSFSEVTKEQVEEAVFNNNAEAQIGDVRYASLEEAIAAVKDGETITLLQNVTLETSLVLNVVGNITIDGNGFTISPAEGYTNEQNGFLMLGDSSYGDAEAATRNYTINNVVFDGVKDWSVIRAQGVTLTVNKCTITNCTQTNGQSLLRLDYTEATIKNTTATDNNALMFITHNFNGNTSQTKLTVDNCTLQNNTWNKTAAIYYVVGGSCTITNSEFINNVVNCNANGAVIYLGFQENCTVTNNLFQENTVNEATASTRVAGAIFFGYEAEISGNAFVNNAASNVNGSEGIAQDVCTSTYYDCTIDLSGNYWGGEEPKAGVNYHVQHQTGEADFELSNYYNSYEIDENGNVVVKEESLVNINYVANVGKFNYTSLQAAIEAAEAGETVTVTLLQDVTLDDDLVIEEGMDVTVSGEGKTITGCDGKDVFYVKGGKLTLTEDLNVHAPTDCAIYLRGGDVFTAANLYKSGDKYSVIQGNGNYAGNVTITGGKVEASDELTAIYWPQNGKLTITGGEIKGHSAVYIASGSLEITGGTLHGVGANGEYSGVTGGSTDSPAEALTIENVGGDSGYELISSVVITGGTFISDNAKAVGSYANTTLNPEAKPVAGFISGGTFTTDVNAYCAEGFQAKANGDGTYSIQFADYIVLPEGVTAANCEQMFGDNTVTDGTNYYATIVAALNGIHLTGNNVLYCKPGANIGTMTHGHVCASLTVYGNGASLEAAGEQDFALDTYKFANNNQTCDGVTAELDLTVKHLNGCGAWGQRTTGNTLNIVFENCKDMNRVYFSGTTGVNNITLTNCSFLGSVENRCTLYSNANGTITVEDCEFNNIYAPVNLNHKVAGEQIVIVEGTSFTNCGTAEYDYAAPVRVLSSVEGATSDVTIDGCTFTNTFANGIGQDADILLDYAISTTVVNVSGTSAKVIVEKEENVNSQEVVVTQEQNATFTNGVMEVAMIDDVKYTSLAAAFEAAQENDVIVLISNVTEEFVISNTANITLDMEDYTLTGAILPSIANVTIKNGTINNSNAGCSAIEINAGTLNLNNVNIASARHAVRIDGDVTATINGGEYTLTATSGTRHAVNVSGGAEVTIKAGTFVGPKGTTMDSGAAVNVQTGATVTIEGGDFSGGKNHTLSADGNLIVTGGTFDQDPSAYLAQGYITKYNETTSRYEVFKGVAKIENEYFASIQDAIDAAQNNDVITVISDFEMDITSGETNSSGHYVLTNVANKAVVIDLNGKKVTVDVTNLPEGCKDNMLMSVFCADTDGNLTLKDSSNGNGSVSVTGGESKTVYSLVIAYGGLVNIEGGNYSVDYMPAGRGMIYGNVSDHSGADGSNVSKGANISGGNFTLGNVGTLANGSPWILATAGSNTGKYIFVTGGTYNADILHQHWIFEVVAPTNKALKNNGNGTYTIVDAVAFVKHHEYSGYYSEIGYATLAEAFEIAETGDVVTLVTNVELENTITVNAGKDVILDLNGKTISGVCNSGQGHMFMVQNTADLTVKDSSENEKGKITYSRGTSNTGWVIDLEGDLILESGTIELTGDSWSIGYAVDVRPNSWGSEYTEATTFTMKGGKLVSSDAAVRVASSSADNHENVSANFIMNGGEIEAAWDGIFVQQSNAAYDILNVRINGGNIKSALSPLRLYGPAATSVLNNVENPITLNITGGTFDYTGNDLGNEKWLVPGVIRVGGDATFEQMLGYTDFEITGGTFEGDVNAYCAEGFAATNNGNGTWTVKPAQEQSLVAGWNWYSSYLDIELEDLTNAIGDNGVQIKNQEGIFKQYNDNLGTWSGSLSEIDLRDMYMVNVKADQTLKVAAPLAVTEEYTITINPGWNWIGYPSNVNVDINTVLDELTPEKNDLIKTQHKGYAQFNYNKWRGALKTMLPGEGYMYYSNATESKTFVYTVEATKGTVEANVTAENNYWTPDATKYPFNMTMTAVVDGLTDANYEVAAFVNGEVRGSARPIYIEEIDAYVLFLTIHGEDVEEMSFRLYDIDNDTEYDLSDRINYSNDAHLGSVNEPYVFSRGTTGIGEAAMSNINIYPNPTTTGTEINLQATCDTVEVYNALGVKVAEYQNVDTIDALETAGIYVIRITNDGNVQNCRLVVK